MGTARGPYVIPTSEGGGEQRRRRSGDWLNLFSFTFCSQIPVKDTEAAKVAEIPVVYGVDPHVHGPVVNSLRKDPKAWLDFMMKYNQHCIRMGTRWFKVVLSSRCEL